MEQVDLAQYFNAIVAAIQLMAAVTGFLFLTVISLVVWIYNKDRVRVDALTNKIDALPPIVEAAMQLRDQVRELKDNDKEQYGRIKDLEEKTTKIFAEHNLITSGNVRPQRP